MAEAVVEPLPSHQRYFCHTCNVRIGRVQEDFTCPTCGGGFVEEIPNNPAPEVDPSYNPIANMFGGGGSNPIFDMLLGGAFPGTSHSHRGHGGGSRGGRGNPNFVEMRQNPGGSFTLSVGGNAFPGGGSGGTGNANPMEHMLNSFLNDLVLGLGGQQGGGGMNMVGNLGDYVWGAQGLDEIVTQLMNQMEGSGPPPLPAEKLDQLPSIRITQEQVNKKLQCSVCWDDFALDEEVKKLDCDHVYHPPCILPWLKLHGTCPICRRDFTAGTAASDDQQSDADSSTGNQNSNQSPSVQPPFPFNFIPQPPSSTQTSYTRTPPTSTQTPRDDIESRTEGESNGRNPRYNMDMEFD